MTDMQRSTASEEAPLVTPKKSTHPFWQDPERVKAHEEAQAKILQPFHTIPGLLADGKVEMAHKLHTKLLNDGEFVDPEHAEALKNAKFSKDNGAIKDALDSGDIQKAGELISAVLKPEVDALKAEQAAAKVTAVENQGKAVTRPTEMGPVL